MLSKCFQGFQYLFCSYVFKNVIWEIIISKSKRKGKLLIKSKNTYDWNLSSHSICYQFHVKKLIDPSINWIFKKLGPKNKNETWMLTKYSAVYFHREQSEFKIWNSKWILNEPYYRTGHEKRKLMPFNPLKIIFF